MANIHVMPGRIDPEEHHLPRHTNRFRIPAVSTGGDGWCGVGQFGGHGGQTLIQLGVIK